MERSKLCAVQENDDGRAPGVRGDCHFPRPSIRFLLATALALILAGFSTSSYAPTADEIAVLEREADGYAEEGNWSRALKIYRDILKKQKLLKTIFIPRRQSLGTNDSQRSLYSLGMTKHTSRWE